MADGDESWSTPALYAAHGRPIEPRMFTEADPIAAVLLADWTSEPAELPWSSTTYVGPRRKRPGPRHAPLAPRTAAVATEVDASTIGQLLDDEPGPQAPAPDSAAASADSAAPADRGLLANSRAMAVASLVSRITGFLRSSLLVAAIGIHGVGDAYNVANNFPNMVYELLLGGVLSSVLVPLLVRSQEDDPDGGIAYTQRLLSIATAVLGITTLIAVACAPLIAAGFVPDESQRSLTAIFATLLLPEIFFYGVGAMFMAVLNIRHSFAAGAWSPVLNNVIMIATIAVFWILPGPDTLVPATITTAQILVLGIGTSLGIAAQACMLIPALRGSGFRWHWRFRAHPREIGRMKEVGSLAGWVLGYVVASQIGVTVIANVGVRDKAFTVFTNADLLIQMPYGILVVSLLTALMPRLSRSAVHGRTDEVIADLGLGARLSAVSLLPVTAALLVLGQALTVVLFAHGATSIGGARLIGTALAASAFGLFPFAIVMLQLRVFYAMRDGRTPTMINIFMVVTKVAIVLGCAALFDDPAKIAVALTVATSASYVVGAIVGHLALTRRLGKLRFGAVAATVTRVAAASGLGGLAAFGALRAVTAALGNGRAGSIASLIVGSAIGLGVLAAVLWRMRLAEIDDLLAMVRRR